MKKKSKNINNTFYGAYFNPDRSVRKYNLKKELNKKIFQVK